MGGLDGLDWIGWMDPAEKLSPFRAPAVLKIKNLHQGREDDEAEGEGIAGLG